MKTTLDLPDHLVRRVKIRAIQQNKKLKDTFAELLEKGMSQTAATPAPDPCDPSPSGHHEISPETGLPLVRSPEDAPIARMSTKQIHVLIHQAQEEEDIERLTRAFPSG